MQAINAAEMEIDQAIGFAETHRKPGPPGVVTRKPPLTATPDDVKYPNLGDARIQIEWAVRHVEDAMQYHGVTARRPSSTFVALCGRSPRPSAGAIRTIDRSARAPF